MWEHRLCGVTLRSNLPDDAPDGVTLVGADQIEAIADAPARPGLMIVGRCEALHYVSALAAPRPLLRVGAPAVRNDPARPTPFVAPWGEHLTAARFVEEFVAQVVVRYAVLRDEGFFQRETHVNVGADGSMQRGECASSDVLVCAAAVGVPAAAQTELLRYVQAGCDTFEVGELDAVAWLQTKAKYDYAIKRVQVRLRAR